MARRAGLSATRAKRGGKKPLWKCPECRRRFVTRNMWHSCGRVSLAEHFKGKAPDVRRVFDAWRRFVRRCGPFTVVAQKTRICFQTRVRFAGAVVRRRHVLCSFWLTRRVEHPLFDGVEFIPPRYHVYRMKVTGPGTLAKAKGLVGLVRESYRLGRQERIG